MYGFHRVIEPRGVVPQAADKVDNIPKILDGSEILVDVEFLNLDSTSMRQLRVNDRFCEDLMETSETEADEEIIKDKILQIIRSRGKMHNPVTNSGGVLLGRIKKIGKDAKNYNNLGIGDFIVPLVSLSAIPLSIVGVDKIEDDFVFSRGGVAVLFDHYPFAKVPPDFSKETALAALDISSIVPQIERLIKPRMKMLVIGCGKAGITAIAVARRRFRGMHITAVDYSREQLSIAQELGYADYYWQMDATNAEMIYYYARHVDFDLVVNVVNVPNTETSSIIAARPGGTVIFFSMATAFDKAALGTDATGKDVTMIIGNGVAEGQAEKMFDLLRTDPKLRGYFERLYGGKQ